MRRFFEKMRISPGTKAFIREARALPGYGMIDALHGYCYGRWPYFCLKMGTGEHRRLQLVKPILNLLLNIALRFPTDKPRFEKHGLVRGQSQGRGWFRDATFADTYHGKVIPLHAAKKIVNVNQEIQLTNLEHVIPYSLARDLVLRKSNRIFLLNCPCRAARSNPCLPLDVCLVMGDPFVGFIAEHHAERGRWIDRDEAIDILTAEAQRGHVHHAFFKEAILGRLFAICNCCACCCGAMQAQRNGFPMLTSSGYLRTIDENKCNGCGTCEKHCQFHAIRMERGLPVANPDGCMGCGVCELKCQQKAISLARDPKRSAPLDLDELLNHLNQRPTS